MNRRVLLGIIIIVLVVVAAILWQQKTKVSGRQAVFLTNGQVYFGKISDTDDKFVTLTEVYYLQQQDLNLQSGKKIENSQVNVIKLGDELHGPEDKMKINRDHILFYETMKNDAKISDAIRRFIESGERVTPINSTPTPTPAQ